MPTGGRGARSPRGSLSTASRGAMCRTGCRAPCSALTGSRFRDRVWSERVGVTARARTGVGRCRGVRSRSRAGWAWTSPIWIMRISHEAIYQSLYVQGRGALRQELTACLRTGRALRVPRARAKSGKSFVTEEIMISERPAEVQDRAVTGHWEGDLIFGVDRSVIGTLVERSSRFTMLLHPARRRGDGTPCRARLCALPRYRRSSPGGRPERTWARRA